MVTYYGRSAWTSAGPVRPLTPLTGIGLRGVAIHWPGSLTPYGLEPTAAQTFARLRGVRSFHTAVPPTGRGWSDIAYQIAIDRAGRVVDLRGIRYRSAANGNQSLNMSWGAVLFMLGPGESPGGQMLAAFADWWVTRWLPQWPHATTITGHGLINDETDCPGPILHRLITTGQIPTATIPGDDMGPVELSTTAVKAVAEACTGAMALHPVEIPEQFASIDPDRVIDGRRFLAPSTALRLTLELLAEQATQIAQLRADIAELRGLAR